MIDYNVGNKFEKIPVLKFIGYNKIVVLFNGRPEVAVIEGKNNVFNNIENIYHISAPAGTVADVEIRPLILKDVHSKLIDGEHYPPYKYGKLRGCTEEELKKFDEIVEYNECVKF